MRKIVFIGVILLALIWVKMNSEEELELGETPEVTTIPDETIQLEEMDNNEPSPVPSLTPSLETSVVATTPVALLPKEPSISPRPSPTPTEKTGEQIAEEKLHIPVEEEIKNATALTTWAPTESGRFTGFFQGTLKLKGQNHILRLSLAFHGGTSDVALRSCVVMYTPEKVVFRESYGDGKIKIFRTKEEKYIILSVADQHYIQIFLTKTKRGRVFRAHLTSPGVKTPTVFYLIQPGEIPYSVEC